MLIIPPPYDHAISIEAEPNDAALSSRPPTNRRPQFEIADVVRQYGQAFLERYGHTSTADNAERCGPSNCVAPPPSGAIKPSVTPVAMRNSLTTRVATGVARSAMGWPKPRGWPTANAKF
jgi:hypothetical protein